MLSWVATWVGVLLFLYGFLSILDSHKDRPNPVLAFMLPGSVIMTVGFVAGCLSAVGAIRAVTLLHARVSARD
jgi:hypothetical protein